MAFGPVVLASVGTADVSAPGAFQIVSIVQVSNSAIEIQGLLPVLDSDGSTLTGLNKVTVAEALADASGLNPFEGLSMDAAVASASSVIEFVVAADTPQAVTIIVPVLHAGSVHAFAIACSD